MIPSNEPISLFGGFYSNLPCYLLDCEMHLIRFTSGCRFSWKLHYGQTINYSGILGMIMVIYVCIIKMGSNVKF